MPRNQIVKFEDKIRGWVSFNTNFLDDKVLYSWDLISNTRDFPDIKLQFIGRLVGDISNILSYFDFTNAKIATDLNQVFIDNRWVNYENNNIPYF